MTGWIKKRGVLYKRGGIGEGEVSIARLIAKLKKIAWGFRWVGSFWIVLGLSGLVFIYGPMAQAQITYTLRPPVVPVETVKQDKPDWQVPDQEYSVNIPKIGAISRVIPDVNAGDEKIYLTALQLGVAEAAGLSHPGQVGTTYLFAHSVGSPIDYARYNAVFYLLDKVEIGDGVEVVYKDKLYRYKVTSVQKLAASDVEYLVPQYDEEKLVLQTCWPPGTSWKRLVLTAKPVMVY